MKIAFEKKSFIENPHKSYISSMSFNPKKAEILATTCIALFLILQSF